MLPKDPVMLLSVINLKLRDYYKDLDDVLDAFTTFANSSCKCTIMCGDDENIKRIKVNNPCMYYGFNEENDVYAKNIRLLEDDITLIDVYIKEKVLIEKITYEHANHRNSSKKQVYEYLICCRGE